MFIRRVLCTVQYSTTLTAELKRIAAAPSPSMKECLILPSQHPVRLFGDFIDKPQDTSTPQFTTMWSFEFELPRGLGLMAGSVEYRTNENMLSLKTFLVT